jgi:hypothetical protein
MSEAKHTLESSFEHPSQFDSILVDYGGIVIILLAILPYLLHILNYSLRDWSMLITTQQQHQKHNTTRFFTSA